MNQGSTYGYDEFNRLVSRTVNSGTVQNYTYVYDRYGNRWQQNAPQGGSTSSLSFNTANNQIIGYTYDAAGNMTYDGFHSYTYDAEGNITAVDSGSTAAYIYNALNQRVRATVGGTATEYVFNAAGQRVSEWNGATRAQLKGKYYWGAKPVAYYANGATHFEHQDWLGTERMRTTYNGGVEGSYQSLPFGDGQATTGADTDANHYATLDHDTETATDHAQFRQYSNTQGRWLSPDPYSGSYDASNPQSMNRYVYVMNSPQAAVDPSGMVAPPGGGRTPSATVCVSIDGGGVCTMIQETNGGIGNGQPGDVIFLGSGSTYSDGKNTYTLTTAGWIDQDGVLLTQATANEVGLPSSINDFSWYLNGFTPYASYQVAQNNAPMANPKAVYAKYAAKPVGPTTPSTSLTPRPMPTTEIPKSALQVALELLEDTLSGLANGSLRGTIPVVVIPPAFNPYSCGKNNPQCII